MIQNVFDIEFRDAFPNTSIIRGFRDVLGNNEKRPGAMPGQSNREVSPLHNPEVARGT